MKHRFSPFFQHIITALSGTALTQIIAGMAQILLVRALGVNGYGTYAYLYALLAIIAALMGAGLDTWLLDQSSRQTSQLRAIMRLITTLKLGIWLIATIVMLTLPLDLPWQYRIFGMVIIGSDSLTNTVWQALRSLNRHRDVAVLQPIGAGLLLTGVWWGAAAQLDTLLALQASIALTMCVIGGVWVWRLAPTTTTSVSFGQLRHGVPFVASDVLAQTYTHSTTIILGLALSTTDVGVFRGALSLVAYSFIFPAVVFNTTLPQLNHAFHQRKRLITHSAGLFGLYGIVAAALIASVGTWGVTLIYGPDYAPSAQLMTSLVALPIIKAASFWGALMLIHQQRLQRRLWVQASVVITLWLIAPPLIRTAGIDGAIAAQLISEGLLALGYIIMAVLSVRLHTPAQQPPRCIYISNTHGVANIGDVAIHHQQLAWLRHAFPDTDVVLSYRSTPAVHHQFPNHTIVAGLSHWVYATEQIAPLVTRLRRTCLLPWAILCLRWGHIPRRGFTAAEHEALTQLARADIVCASGGGYLYDAPTRHPVWRFITWDIWLIADMYVALCLHKPLYLLPQSLGPIHSPLFRRAVLWICNRATAVYVRESTSSQWLDYHRIPHQSLPDLAWLQQSDIPPIEAHTLGITVIDWARQYDLAPAHQQHYEDVIVAVCQTFHRRGWQISLFVQCREAHPAWDDGVVASRIQARCPACVIAAYTPDPYHLQTQYARMQVLLTTRLHAAILRIATGRPAVVIAYLPKAQGIMTDLGLATWVHDYHQLTETALITSIDTAAEQIPIIAEQVPHLRRQLATAAAELQQHHGNPPTATKSCQYP